GVVDAVDTMSAPPCHGHKAEVRAHQICGPWLSSSRARRRERSDEPPSVDGSERRRNAFDSIGYLAGMNAESSWREPGKGPGVTRTQSPRVVPSPGVTAFASGSHRAPVA